jgi:hypothetical protein
MLKKVEVLAQEVGIQRGHPLWDHFFSVKQLRAAEDDGPHGFIIEIGTRDGSPSPHAGRIEIVDNRSFEMMWEAFTRRDAQAILRGVGKEHLMAGVRS